MSVPRGNCFASLALVAAASGDPTHELLGGAALALEARHDGPVSALDDPAAVVTRGTRCYVAGRSRAAGFGRFLVLAFDVPGAAPLWTTMLGDGESEAEDAALSPDGSTLFVAGTVAEAPDFETDLLVVALDAATGTERWSARHTPPAGRDAEVAGLAVGDDGSGTRVWVAATDRGGAFTDADMLVAAWDGATGAALWTDTFDGPDAMADRAAALAVTPDGASLLVTGASFAAATGDDYLTLAYDAATGARRWSRRHTGPGRGAGSSDAPRAIAIAPGLGLAVVTGMARSTDETVAYDIATGTPVWTGTFTDEGLDVAVRFTGIHVFVTGVERGVGGADDDAVTVCHRGFDGAVVWTARFDSGAEDDRPVATAVAPGGASLLVTGTRFHDNASTDQFTVAFRTIDGAETWRSEFTGPGAMRDDAQALAVSDDGLTVLAAGSSRQPQHATDVALLYYDAGSGAELAQVLHDETAGGFDEVLDLAVGEQGSAVYTAGSTGWFGTFSETVAWDPATGTELWTARFPTSEGFAGGGERVVVDPSETTAFVLARSDADAHLVAYRASDGAELWRVVRGAYSSAARGDMAASPDGSRVYALFGDETSASLDWRLAALDAATGAVPWEATLDAGGLADRPHAVVVAPDGARVFAAGASALPGTGGEDALVAAFDAAGGPPVWTARHAGPLVGGVGLDESAELAALSPSGGTLCLGVNARDASGAVVSSAVVALETAGGSERWATPPAAGEEVVALAISDGGSRVHVLAHTAPDDPLASDLVVAALDAATGAILWRRVLDDGAGDRGRALALDPDGVTLYVTSIRGAMPAFAGVTGGDVATRALDAESGASLWFAAYDGPGGSGAPGGTALGDDRPSCLAVSAAGDRVFVAGRSDGVLSASDALLLGYARPTLAADPPAVGLAAGGPHALHLRADAARAGWAYWMFGSATGSAPGQALPNGTVLPLVPDMYFAITAKAPQAAVFEGWLGTLDGAGRASARLLVPPASDPGLAGMTLHHAYLAAPMAGGFDVASNAVSVSLVP